MDSASSVRMESSMIDVRPEPLGKILPSLRGSYAYNTEHTLDCLAITCPSCGSDNVCIVVDPNYAFQSPQYPDGSRRWFCITCKSSWIYVRDEEEDEHYY